MNIGNFEIGKGETFVIAELCSNVIRHLDNLEGIIEMVAATGAQAAKVQLYHHSHFSQKEWAQKSRTEFPRDRFGEFTNLCHRRDLLAGASVFDEDAVDLAVSLGADFLKLATRESNNHSLRYFCDQYDLPVLWSFDVSAEPGGKLSYQDKWLPIACVPQYPAETFRVPTWMYGWSSHTSHWRDVLVAVSRDAGVIEKHIGFDKNDPEMGWSLYPEEFGFMVKDIRWTEGVR